MSLILINIWRRKSKRRKPDGSDQESSSQDNTGQTSISNEYLEDAEEHDGWWQATKSDQIKEYVAIEFLPGTYAKALPNGTIVLGDAHPPGEGPDEEEIFLAVNISADQFAFKSGFERYLSVDSDNHITGISEAISELECFTVVYEDGKTAICAANDKFLSPQDSDTKPILARSTWVSQNECLKVRINYDPTKSKRVNI